jgi:hypothetical protein
MPRHLVSTLISIVGAVIGGALGYWLFFWFARHGFYALIIPGALLGFGCGLFAQHRSTVRGIVSGVAAFLLTVYTDFGFEGQDGESLRYFVTRYHELGPVTLLMTVVGTLLGFWMGKDSGYLSVARKPEPPQSANPPATG